MPTTEIKQAKREFKEKALDPKQDILPYDPGVLTDFEGNGTARVSTLVDHAYVSIGNEEAPIKVLNRRVPFYPGLAVYVGIDPIDGVYQVMGLRDSEYIRSGQNYPPRVPEHHESHQFQDSGYDLVWSDFEQISTLMIRAAPDLGNFWVRMTEGPLPRGTGWIWVSAANGNTVTLNLAGDVPVAGGLMALVYLDDNGDLQRKLSATVGMGSLDITLTPAPDEGEFALAAVRLYSSQTSISDNYTTRDIIQLRFPQYNTAGDPQASVNNRKLIEMGWGGG